MGTALLANHIENENLVSDALGNEVQNANQFVNANKNFVFSTALRYTKDYDDADDITQEVLIKALSNLGGFNHQSSVKTWLYRITVNMCLNYKRKKSLLSFFSYSNSDNDFEIESKEASAHSKMENSELYERFNHELTKLPEKQRETFALRYFHDLSYQEISELLGTSVGGLKANYFQAVKKLAQNMKDLR
ncbi:MAG: RNA polymerase sigma factor [Desulfobulbaceae bacterium]|nr:RNA polymerase sigma factor [Candidatus Kapabacteria bacterium]MBS3999815.1 RNA polymerase sigma factor [Desulfobulbaceae bacterium]